MKGWGGVGWVGWDGAGWGGVGWGHLLTFFVLLPLHVATLHRCLIVLLSCIHEGVGCVGGHANVSCASSGTCCCCYAAQMSGSVASLYTLRGGVGGRGKYQLPHWNSRCRMLCCQRLDPQIIVFKEQRSSPRCEVLAVEIRESVHPSPAKNNFNAEAPALKRNQEKACQHAPTKWIQNPHEAWSLPNSRARIWHNLACRYVCFAVAKMFRLEKRCFYKHGFRSGCFYRSIFGWLFPMTFICGWVETTNH